ncbi:PAS domain-containing protein [Amorphus sp. MBR-141]
MSPVLPTVESLQKILNAIQSPVFLIDRDHRIVMVNDAFCRFARVEKDQILGTIGDTSEDQRKIFWKNDD